MSSLRKTGFIILVLGILLLAYGVWALFQGSILSTWLRWEYSTGAPFWITVMTLIGLGAANIVLGLVYLFRNRS